MSKPKAITIREVHRTRRTIFIHWEQGDGAFDLDEPDNPLPAFVNAFEALPAVVCTVLHMPESFATSLRVIGLKIGTQGGVDTVSFICRKDLSDAAKEWAFATPPRLLAHPSEPGSYTPPLKEKDAAKVHEAIEQAKEYVKGERAQGVIDFKVGADDDESDADGKDGDKTGTLNFPAPEGDAPAASPKQKRTPKKKK